MTLALLFFLVYHLNSFFPPKQFSIVVLVFGLFGELRAQGAALVCEESSVECHKLAKKECFSATVSHSHNKNFMS
jgi:hypothetical protein